MRAIMQQSDASRKCALLTRKAVDVGRTKAKVPSSCLHGRRIPTFYNIQCAFGLPIMRCETNIDVINVIEVAQRALWLLLGRSSSACFSLPHECTEISKQMVDPAPLGIFRLLATSFPRGTALQLLCRLQCGNDTIFPFQNALTAE